MKALARSLRESGAEIPVPWPSLARLVKPRPGHLAILLAAPGVGKSSFAVDWVIRVGMPAIGISLDTSLNDQAMRVAARLSDRSVSEIERDIDPEKNSSWREVRDQWSAWLAGQDIPVKFTDQVRRTSEIDELIRAETDFWGEPPQIVIIDDISNLLEAEESVVEYSRILRELKRIAQNAHTFVLGLHHVNRGPAADGWTPVTLNSGIFAGERIPEILLGLWNFGHQEVAVGVLKNRMGRGHGGGKLFARLAIDLGRCRFEEPLQLVGAAGAGMGPTADGHSIPPAASPMPMQGALA